ncbi:MAG: NADH-quinone oxidoreductase subunit M [Gloeomargarita sp. SKYG116]|nr:NADH-quinone oxidoreductase subunit M [Gloeomargarita sp. SKYG116]MDW8400186.1 NADH-quinone oxidoreductase subunit M [Gloeomargarita sp. SKYGB_i_bin116]
MLSGLIGWPLLGVLLLWLAPGRWVRSVALATVAVVAVWTGVLLAQFDVHTAGWQMVQSLPWLDNLGLSYRLAVDGLSLPLLGLNSLIVALVVASHHPASRPRLYYSLVLLAGAAVAGAFLAQNLLLFFLFYELELLPLYLLIAIWGGPRRDYAAVKFLVYTAISGLLLLAAFFGLVVLSGAGSFDYEVIAAKKLGLGAQIGLLVLLLLGLGIKIPLVPLHTWLPDAHVEASTEVSMLLAGVLLKLGTYGLLRFGVQLLPEGWRVLAPVLAVWAVVSVLYGSLMAIGQQDMKRVVAFSSIGHMGYVLLAAAAATPLSLVAAVAQMVSHGLIAALLFFLVGVVYRVTGTRDLAKLQGLLTPERGLPVVGSLMILAVMASSGIPGMVGFISEFMVFRGSFPVFPVPTVLAMLGTALTSVYFLLLVNRAFFGRLTPALAELPPVTWGQRLPAVVLAGLVVMLGLQPSWLVRWSEVTVSDWGLG